MLPFSQSVNNQNKANMADFSSSHPFHRCMQELPRSIWAPPAGGLQRQTRLFYKRARGQSQDALAQNLRDAGRRKWELIHPRSQFITKIDLAKYEHSRSQLPHIISRGGQKCHLDFMDVLGQRGMFEPDDRYLEFVVARSILFRKGPRVLKRFLDFAKTGVVEERVPTGLDADSSFEEDVSRVIRGLGYKADPQVGTADFRIDIGVRHPDRPGQYIVAVECDGAAYHAALDQFVLTEEQAASPPVRDRRAETGAILKAEYLPPMEIAAAAARIRSESGLMLPEEMTRTVARLLGFQRVGPDLSEAILAVVMQAYPSPP